MPARNPRLNPPATTGRSRLEYVPVQDLKPDPDNAREHTRPQIRQIANSIEAFGFGAPILADKNLKVIAGHGRLEALKLLGRTEAPVIRLEHLTPEQARAYAIADNRLTETSRFNAEKLAQQMKALAEIDLDFSIEATGFSMGEIDLMIEGLEVEPATNDPDDAAVTSGPAVAKIGDIWALGEHRIICGSALDQATYDQLLGDERVDAAISDPPYNVPVHGHISGKGKRKHREFVAASGEMSGPEFTTFLSGAVRNVEAFSKPGSVHFWFQDWRHIHPLLAVGSATYDDLINICIWNKPNAGMGSLYRSAHEMIAVFRKGGAAHRNNVQLGRFGRNRTNVWTYAGANSFLRSAEDADLMGQHPTPKAVAMIAEAILDVTARRDLVLDAFLGSGTALIACERTGRRCRGIELDPLYVDLSIRRWMRLTGEDAVRIQDGARFSALEQRKVR